MKHAEKHRADPELLALQTELKQSRKSAPAPELAALRAELRDAQSELALAYRQFDQATAPELVEACIYRISAAKARCDYYLRVLKAQEPEAAGSVRGGALWT